MFTLKKNMLTTMPAMKGNVLVRQRANPDHAVTYNSRPLSLAKISGGHMGCFSRPYRS